MLYGNTAGYEDFLKSQFGSYNKYLPEGPGWLFSKKREIAIRRFFQNLPKQEPELTVETVCKWIDELRTFRGRGVSSPHKPVYLLTIIKLISTGVIDNKIYLNDILIDTFKEVWTEVVPTPNSFTIDICNPYIHMASEPFYKLKMKRNDISYLEVKKSIGAIQEACEYAEIDSRFVELVNSRQNRMDICNYICNYYKLH